MKTPQACIAAFFMTVLVIAQVDVRGETDQEREPETEKSPGEMEDVPCEFLPDPFDDERNLDVEVLEDISPFQEDVQNPLAPLPDSDMVSFVRESWKIETGKKSRPTPPYNMWKHGARLDYTLKYLKEGTIPSLSFLEEAATAALSNKLRSFYIAVALVGEENGLYEAESAKKFRNEIETFLLTGWSGSVSEADFLYDEKIEPSQVGQKYVAFITKAREQTLENGKIGRPIPDNHPVSMFSPNGTNIDSKD